MSNNKIISGTIDSSGNPITPTSSKSSRTGTGAYQVKFPADAFTENPSVVVTPTTENLGDGYVVSISLQAVGPDGFSVYIQNLSNPARNVDASFNFIAVPRN